MIYYILLLHLTGAIALLLWAVRMVRTGVERSQEIALRRALMQSNGGKLRAAAIGAVVALLLQSSTAVAALTSGFAGNLMPIATGMAVMLGAYFGSSLVVLVVSADFSLLVPVLLFGGSVTFFKGATREWKQFGRILIGIALTLVSLDMIGEATAPLREAGTPPIIVDYLKGDFASAFLIGAAFTWLVHSSVASTLLIVTLAVGGLVPEKLAVSLVLGANFGGTLIGLGLATSNVDARRIAWGQMLFRALGSVIVLLAYNLLTPDISNFNGNVATEVIAAHILFNLAVLIVGLPLTGLATRLVTRVIKPKPTPEELVNPLAEAPTCLDQTVIGMPALALASATRELLRMAGIIQRMLTPLMELYQTGDPNKIRQARMLEKAVDQAQSEIKLYLAKIDYTGASEAQRGNELSNFAINLEYVGDAITKTLLKLAETRRDQKLQFSPEGWCELSELHDRVLANIQLALNVLVSQDRESARQLLLEKAAVSSAERESYGQHLNRLRSGTRQSLETSNIHLETVRALKTINSLFASVAYPILEQADDVL